MAGQLEGKVAFIAGAARGQGRSHALRLAEEGADIIAVDLCKDVDTIPYPLATPEDLAETVSQVEALDRRIIASQADTRDFEALEAAVEKGVAELGRLDIVLGNAGVVGPYKPLVEMTTAEWQNMIDIDLTGVYNTAKAGVPHIRKGGRGGSIVMTSSIVGFKVFPNTGAYMAAKVGLTGLMKSLAVELADDMIRVNTIHPTQVDTPMIMNQVHYDLFSGLTDRPGTREDFAPISQGMNALPIPWVDAKDISNAVLFLVSDQGRYITGVTLPVDAGAQIKY